LYERRTKKSWGGVVVTMAHGCSKPRGPAMG